MAKIPIYVKAKPKAAGLVTVFIDGKFVGLDANGEDVESVSKPPAKHWYVVSISGQPGDSVDYQLTDNAQLDEKGSLTIADGNTLASTYKVFFTC